MYRLRESDTVRFLCYLNVTKAIIITVKEGGLSLQMEDTKKCCNGQKEEGEEEEGRQDGISASLCSLWLR